MSLKEIAISESQSLEPLFMVGHVGPIISSSVSCSCRGCLFNTAVSGSAGAVFTQTCDWNPHAVAALRRKLRVKGVADECQIYFEGNRKVSAGEIWLLTIQTDFPHILPCSDFHKISVFPRTKHGQRYCWPSTPQYTKYYSHIEWFYSEFAWYNVQS